MLDPLCLIGIPQELSLRGWGHPSFSNTDHLKKKSCIVLLHKSLSNRCSGMKYIIIPAVR